MPKFGFRAILFILPLFFSFFIFRLEPALSKAEGLFAFNDIYVVHFVLDGLRADVLQEFLAKEDLPNLKSHFVGQGASFENVFTTFPTVSTPGYVSFVTGLGSSNSNLFFLEWFDRSRKKVIGYLTRKGFKRVNADLLNRLALKNPNQKEFHPPITLFEKLKPEVTAAIYTPFRKGATLAIPRRLPLGALWHGLVTQDGFALDKAAMKGLEKLFSKKLSQIPRYTLVGLYGSDFWGHKEGPTSEEIHWNLKLFDDLFGKFLEKLKARGISGKTYLILSSDHGMHATGKLFKLREALWKNGIRDKSVYVSNRGVSSTFLYVKGERDPKQLTKILLSQEEVDWIALRDGLDRVRILSTKGEGILQQVAVGSNTFDFYSHQGDDPLRNALPSSVALSEVGSLFQNPNAGDILVVAKEPYSFRKAKAGTHGSLTQEDMHIPLWISGPTIPKRRFSDMVASVDLFPTVLSWFGLPQEDFGDHEGKILLVDSHPAVAGWHLGETTSLLATLLSELMSRPPLFKMVGRTEFIQSIQNKIPPSLGGKLLIQCGEELDRHLALLKKLEDLQTQLHGKNNPLRVPRKLKKNMAWVLAQEKDWELARLKKLEDLKEIIVYSQ